MSEHRHAYPVTEMCKVLRVSRSGYYKYMNNEQSERETYNKKLRKEIEFIFKTNRRIYGSRRITGSLRQQGYEVNRKRVQKLMRDLGLAPKKKRKRYKKQNREGVEVNLLQQYFMSDHPNTRWVSDITEIRTISSKVYICAIMDLYSRYIVGYAAKTHCTSNIIKKSLCRAELIREIERKMIFHSDKGVQYRSTDIKDMLKKRDVRQSMSGTGNCYDNAAMESFFATLKKEFLYRYTFKDYQELKSGLDEYIDFYNTYRLHSTLGYKSPKEYERMRKTS